jgi:predicted ArsR family transcriptional regulator
MDTFDQEFPWMRGWFVSPSIRPAGLPDIETYILAEIEARWDSEEKISLFNQLANQYGEAVDRALEQAVAANVLPEWQGVAADKPSHTLEEFMRILWEPLHEKGFDFTVQETPVGLQVDCRKCPLADWAKAHAGERWLYILGCGTDPYMLAGFNPALGFKRTRTLMQGHDRCDHTYARKPGDPV